MHDPGPMAGTGILLSTKRTSFQRMLYLCPVHHRCCFTSQPLRIGQRRRQATVKPPLQFVLCPVIGVITQDVILVQVLQSLQDPVLSTPLSNIVPDPCRTGNLIIVPGVINIPDLDQAAKLACVIRRYILGAVECKFCRIAADITDRAATIVVIEEQRLLRHVSLVCTRSIDSDRETSVILAFDWARRPGLRLLDLSTRCVCCCLSSSQHDHCSPCRPSWVGSAWSLLDRGKRPDFVGGVNIRRVCMKKGVVGARAWLWGWPRRLPGGIRRHRGLFHGESAHALGELLVVRFLRPVWLLARVEVTRDLSFEGPEPGMLTSESHDPIKRKERERGV
jgi:hypothetical protein